MTPAPGNAGVWYYGRQLPRNVAEVAGFPPLLPTWFPARTSWDSALLVGPQYGPGQAPLLREVYAIRSPHSSGTLPNPYAAFVLDETTGTFGPLTGLNVDVVVPLHVVEPRAVMLGSVPAALFHLTNDRVSAPGYQIAEVLWQEGSLALRLVTSAFDYWPVLTSDQLHSRGTTLKVGLDLPNFLDADLLAIGGSIEAYTDCILTRYPTARITGGL